jgi:osmotically-inducible protein OsmY
VQLAETTRGLRGLVNHLRVEGQWRDDDQTSWQVSHALSDVGESPQELIRVTQGRVVLGGKVASWAQKERAEIATRDVPGVLDVDNQLAVVPKAPLSEQELYAEVEKRLQAEHWLKGQPIEVTASGGTVTLRGTLDTLWARQRALQLASIDGARAVDAQALVVSPRRPLSAPPAPAGSEPSPAAISGEAPAGSRALSRDESLQREVSSRLKQHPSITSSKIHVAVKRGAITLLGSVGSDFQSSCAERVTRLVPGAGAVDNRLRLEPTVALVRDDSALARALEEELWWDARIDPAALHVKVENGTATISGEVETSEQRDAILENALQVAPPRFVSEIQVHELDQLAHENADFEQ